MDGGSHSNGGTVDRRKLLLGGGVAAGVMWVAPQINSIASAGPLCSPSGCTPVTVNLLSAPFGAGANVASGNRNINGTVFSASRTNTDTIANGPGPTIGTQQSATTGVIIDALSGGIAGGHIPLCGVGSSNASIALTLNFNPGVRKLRFTLTDIDAYDVGTDRQVWYQEQVVIGGPSPANGPGVPGAWTNGVGDAVAQYPSPGSGLVLNGTNRYQASSATFNAPQENATCNLRVEFENCGTITSVTITSNDISPGVGSSGVFGRMVTLTSLGWCV